MAVPSAQRILERFFRWSSETGARLDDAADLECLYDLERFVGEHLNKQIEAVAAKRRGAARAELAAVKRLEMEADRLAASAACVPICEDDGRWLTLSQQQRDDIANEKEIVDRIYKLQLRQDRLLKIKK